MLGIEIESFHDRYLSDGDTRTIAATIRDELPAWQTIAEVNAAGELVYAGSEREQMFDGVLMRERRYPRHIGTVIYPGTLIHVERGRTSVAESYRGPYLCPRVVGIYRQPIDIYRKRR